MDNFSTNTECFVNWLEKNAKIEVSPKIKIKDLRSDSQGRGIVAIQKVKKDEVLFEIPRTSVLNITTSKLVRDYPWLEEKFLNEMESWEGLIICILYEMEVLKEKSQWAPYFNVWNRPKDMNTLIFWNEKELELLQPSLVLERMGRKEAKEMYEGILKMIEQIGGKLADVAVHFEFDDFAYIASIILSYSFDMEMHDNNADESEEDSEEEPESNRYLKSMIPLADTLNADTSKFNANLTYDSGSLKMVAVKDIGMNEQVYNVYGEHPNSEILRRYGYVEWDGSKHDFGEVLLKDIVDVLKETLNASPQFLESCIAILRTNTTIQDLLEGEDIVLNSYECYFDGESVPQSIVFVQTLTILCQIPGLSEMNGKILERQVERVIKKCLQLIEGGRVTENYHTTWKRCITKRLEKYSLKKIDLFKPPSEKDLLTDEDLRGLMAQRVLKSEVESLRACENSAGKNYKIIPDQKLLANILKSKPTTSEESAAKRPCIRK
ncbi:ribosomal lysine N-methyltransferase [Saccharomyces eubayanus]|uniref:ribosomal lysine N-methyltransferase n=1 Tax=Saccharomyces eubayanus TaxID=1080349 RepID=UPI0006C14C7E|nr:RKM4-like protein [Saccharomyces eubayanus]KOH01088.1 RKM4-like protein [Saccharomyces eubayanus]